MRSLLRKKIVLLATCVLTLMAHNGFAHKREIALTIDDLPFVGKSHLHQIIRAIKANDIPVTGFVIAGNISPANWQLLRQFREAGLGLGNHTLSHANLNTIAVDNYIQEIDAADKILQTVMTEPKYFRYPYLAMSHGPKKEKVLQHLLAKNYQIAPITIDSRDFVFNQLLASVSPSERPGFLAVLKPCYLDFIWQQTLKAEERNRLRHKPDEPQILLIHANLLNAYVLPDLINFYRQNGFTFVSLDEALKTNGERQIARGKTLPSKTDADLDSYLAWD